jgi:hypothetical protein
MGQQNVKRIKKRKRLKGLDIKTLDLRAMEISMEKFLGIRRPIKQKRIFRKESAYISR